MNDKYHSNELNPHIATWSPAFKPSAMSAAASVSVYKNDNIADAYNQLLLSKYCVLLALDQRFETYIVHSG